LTFNLTFGINAFANTCDFKLSNVYYLKTFKYALEYLEYYNPYASLAVNSPDTIIGNWQEDGHKTFTIQTLLEEECLEVKKKEFDSADNLTYSYSYVLKNYQLMQVIFNGVVMNIVHGETPCDFTVVKSLNESIVFNFNDTENFSEYRKLERNFPNRTLYRIIHYQIGECIEYKEYLEKQKYLEEMKWLLE
jgi:hypothetical protein